MASNAVAQRVFELLETAVAEQGCELLDVEYGTENGSKILRLIIDKNGGVGLDDCADVSHAVEPLLDIADPVPAAYELEVSSPGIDRPLTTEKDFGRSKGMLVEIFLKSQVNRRDRYEGILDDFNDTGLTLTLDEPFIKGVKPKTNGTQMNFLRSNIKLIRRAIRF